MQYLLLLVTGQLCAACVGFLIGCSDHRQSLVRSRIRDHSHCVLYMPVIISQVSIKSLLIPTPWTTFWPVAELLLLKVRSNIKKTIPLVVEFLSCRSKVPVPSLGSSQVVQFILLTLHFSKCADTQCFSQNVMSYFHLCWFVSHLQTFTYNGKPIFISKNKQ